MTTNPAAVTRRILRAALRAEGFGFASGAHDMSAALEAFELALRRVGASRHQHPRLAAHLWGSFLAGTNAALLVRRVVYGGGAITQGWGEGDFDMAEVVDVAEGRDDRDPADYVPDEDEDRRYDEWKDRQLDGVPS